MSFDRDVFFEKVKPMFGGKLTQQQVDGMGAILDTWEASFEGQDLRWLANPLAQAKWESSSTMWSIEEYGKGAGQPYGVPDPETGQTYYGRGLIQCTWRANYAKADQELGLHDDASTEWHADGMLDIDTAAAVMFVGMMEGWFRSVGGAPCTLVRYFNTTTDDPFNARDIINGDKNYTKEWLPKGMTVGQYIAKDHDTFLAALKAAFREEPAPPLKPVRPAQKPLVVQITIDAPEGVEVKVTLAAPKETV